MTVIQRTLRGHSSRKIAAAMRAERRVVMALQTLLSELSSPEMKGAGKSILQVPLQSPHLHTINSSKLYVCVCVCVCVCACTVRTLSPTLS